MRAREFISEKRTDEIAPIIAAAGGALARGAGSMLAKGAKAAAGAVGNAVKQGAMNLATAGVKKLGDLATGGTQQAPKPGEAGSGQTAIGTSGPGEPVQKTQADTSQPVQNTQQQAQQKQQQQAQQKQQQELSTNLDKIAAQLVALKQDLLKQQV